MDVKYIWSKTDVAIRNPCRTAVALVPDPDPEDVHDPLRRLEVVPAVVHVAAVAPRVSRLVVTASPSHVQCRVTNLLTNRNQSPAHVPVPDRLRANTAPDVVDPAPLAGNRRSLNIIHAAVAAVIRLKSNNCLSTIRKHTHTHTQLPPLISYAILITNERTCNTQVCFYINKILSVRDSTLVWFIFVFFFLF